MPKNHRVLVREPGSVVVAPHFNPVAVEARNLESISDWMELRRQIAQASIPPIDIATIQARLARKKIMEH
ncbi:MAG TPA: hypothetical protein VFE75_02095, partial [Rhodanobacter sp.]|nr:hypothetical protein [Rhodanobacter sp.]